MESRPRRNNQKRNNKRATTIIRTMQAYDSALSSKAFGDLADPGLIVAYQSHQDALRFLTAALGRGNGVALLRGPSGSGKSTTLREQFAALARDSAVAMVEGEQLTPRSLVKIMLEQFGIDVPPLDDDQRLLQRLSAFLTEKALAGETPVLIIDDVDKASSSVLRLLNWLAALESRDRFGLRLLLAGQDRLLSLVNDHGMRHLARRHPALYSLNPLTEQETVSYLRTRWIAAGRNDGEDAFSLDVCARLHEVSGGWPGSLNSCAIAVADGLARQAPSQQVPSLHVTRDGRTLASYDLTKHEYVIGRSDLADIVIEDTYISKVHAMLKVYGNAVMLIDLNSTNGTSVNSRMVQKTVLRSNDIITLGHYKIKVENVPALSAEMEEEVQASDTMRMKNLGDLRRARARRTIRVLKHK
ncbi:MAG: FHA domain-containing protein [Chromatiales bacterium]|nr:MAG: FHA domain-containing protein [Chromatiales bacterium]